MFIISKPHIPNTSLNTFLNIKHFLSIQPTVHTVHCHHVHIFEQQYQKIYKDRKLSKSGMDVYHGPIKINTIIYFFWLILILPCSIY